MDITEHIDEDCREEVGHTNWACADTIGKDDEPQEEHSRHIYEGQEVIFYVNPVTEEE